MVEVSRWTPGRAPSFAAIAAGWAALLVIAWVLAGRTGLGTALTASFMFQVAPSVWTAYRTHRPTGISRGTWLLILAELLSWGVYGMHKSDPRLTVLGWTGVAASVLMLARIRRRRLPAAHRTPALSTDYTSSLGSVHHQHASSTGPEAKDGAASLLWFRAVSGA